MKLILRATFLALALGVVGVLTHTAVSAQAGQEPKPHDMTGCLAKGEAAGTYKLTSPEKGVTTVEIVQLGKDVMKIDAHLGHRVTITGVAVPAPKEGMKGHFMRVDSFKHVAPTCP
jgi:hypothetical protein